MEAFQTLAEVAVAVAGFSSLAIVFRGRTTDWTGQDYISLAFAMCWSIGSVFFSLFPIVVVEFGFDLSESSRVGLIAIAFYMLFVAAMLMYARRKIALSGGGEIRVNLGMSVLFMVIFVGALTAGFGWTPGPPHAWFATIIVLLMAHATAELGLLVIGMVRETKGQA